MSNLQSKSWLAARRPPVWNIGQDRAADTQALIAALGLPPLVCRVLAHRGLTDPDEARAFLEPKLSTLHDPFGLADMDRASERVARAVRAGEKIAIFGDYDVDGLTATALLARMFGMLGVEVERRIPHRVNDGYGLNLAALEELHGKGVSLVITVDTGISALREIEAAAALGLDVVVTDHHLPGPELPRAVAVINPNRADCAYACSHLCGVGVAFKFAHAVLKALDHPAEASKQFLIDSLDLVAIGSISDIVPLVGENRAMAYHGLKRAATTQKVGLRALMEALNIAGSSMTPHQVGFLIGPRLNAAGRTETAEIALELLMTEDANRAREIVGLLGAYNENRKKIETGIFDEAVALIESEGWNQTGVVLVAAAEGWHTGVIGIVASRLVGRYGRPAFVMGIENGRAKGSARSVPGYDLVAALDSCAEHLIQYGGHAMAAGLQLHSENIDAFRQAIVECAAATLNEDSLRRRLDIDAETTVDELTMECVEALDGLAPHGQGNPEPVVAIRGVRMAERPRIVGNGHLKMRLVRGGRTLDVIGFNMGDEAEWLWRHEGEIDVAGSPFANEYRGSRNVELKLKDVRAAEA